MVLVVARLIMAHVVSAVLIVHVVSSMIAVPLIVHIVLVVLLATSFVVLLMMVVGIRVATTTHVVVGDSGCTVRICSVHITPAIVMLTSTARIGSYS